jgi:lysophospholipase L1-like esterase
MGKVFTSLLINAEYLETSLESDMSAGKQITIWILGDSTASSYASSISPLTGWGQIFGDFFESGVVVRNESIPGRSTKSFIDEGHFARIIKDVRPGDFLLIQFGHNDEKKHDLHRYADLETYKKNLSFFVESARSAGAHPIILTSIERRLFQNGVLHETHGEYPEAARSAAKETKTPCIDITAKSKMLFTALGEEGTKKIFLILGKGVSANYPDGIIDNSHLQTEGARIMGKMVLEGFSEQSIPLTEYVKKQFRESEEK